MTICKYCGFDSDKESMVAEGVPCGIANCYIKTCCIKAWEDHKKLYHKKEEL